jgi:putative surface-exposed virulence protein
MSFFHDQIIAHFERGRMSRLLFAAPAAVLSFCVFAAMAPDRASAGAINCSFITVSPGNTAVTCTDGADVSPDGGLEIDLEDESVFLDGVDITPSPFDTEETDVTVNLGYSDAVGQGLYLETTDSDGVVILTDDTFMTTINFGADGSIVAEYDGIQVTASSNYDGRGDVVINSRGDITAGSYGEGIQVWRTEGNIYADVTITNEGTILAGGDGVRVTSDGTVTINNLGSIGTEYDPIGDAGIAIYGSGYGAAVVDNQSLLSIHAYGSGIVIEGKGSVDIDNDDGLIDAGDEGISLSLIDGPVEIRNHGGSITGYWDGIDAEEVEGTFVVRNSFGGSITGLYGDGIDLYDIDDNVTIYNIFGDIYGGDDGIKVADVWDGNVTIHNSFGDIAGDGGKGLRVEEVNGNVTINNALFGDIWGYWDGVKIAGVEGRVTILNSFGGEIEGEEGDGIDIEDVDDDVTIYNRFGGRITGEDDAITIYDVWQGDVTIYNDEGTIRAWHGDAIVIGDVDGSAYIYNGEGSIRGAEHAISIEAEWVEINSEGTIRGEGSEDYPTIRLATEDGAVINNDAGGVIRGDDYASTDLIVVASGGPVEINNSGDMMGRIDLAAAGSTDLPNVFNNMSADSWTFTGTSEFGGGLADEFNNTGTVHTTDPDDPEFEDDTIFAGLEFFNNGGPDADGTIDMQDGHTGDVTTIRPTDGGDLVFFGEEGRSFVSIDAFLAGPEADTADLLVIEGQVTGRTQLNVTNLNPDGAFYNPDGVKVVEAYSSSGDGSEFFLDGPVKAGFFDYGLFFEQNGTDDWYLRSDVNGDGEALASIQTGMTTLFHDSTGTWNQRTTELRDAFTGSVVATHGSVSLPPTSGPGHGSWLVAFGGSRDRSATFTSLIDTYDTSYRQGLLGVIGGLDTRLDTGRDDVLLAGLMGGYIGSTISFPSESSIGSMRGGSVGAYLTYMNGGLFADLLVKADFLTIRHTADGATATTNGRAIGAIADVGYRMNGGEAFVEPLATLAYVNTTTGAFTLLGTDVSFPDGNSLLGRLGVRVGAGGVADATHRVETYLTASVWNEFLGGDTATIVGLGGDPVTVTNDGIGLYFEVGAGVEVASLTNGVSGFLRGDFQFGDSIRGGSGRGGVRVNW